jgi:DnaJ family protein C protein 8
LFMLRINMEEKRRRLKKEGKPYAVEEDDPIKFKIAVNILTMKLFADLERK